MSKYSSRNKPEAPPRNRDVHPVMRGIGCIMMVVVPLFSYGLSVILVETAYKRGWPLPPAWSGRITIHPLLLRLNGLKPFWDFLATQDNLVANLIFTFAITVLIGGIMSIFFGYIYRLFGPPQYGPTDEPPIRKKVKKYTR
jgi:hypothetical protein